MKKYLNFRYVFVFCMVLSLTLAHPLAVFADVKDLMISTDSNALMTLELDDTDYLMMSPRSSVGIVGNTVSMVKLYIIVSKNGSTTGFFVTPEKVDGRFDFSFSLPSSHSDYVIDQVQFNIVHSGLKLDSLPRPAGQYNMSFDFSSDFNVNNLYGFYLYSAYEPVNAKPIEKKTEWSNYEFSHGDFYLPPMAVNVKHNCSGVRLIMDLPNDDAYRNFGGSFALRFELSSSVSSNAYDFAGPEVSVSDYESDVSSSLSDLSSSVGEMSDEISGVTEAIQNLQGAMEPHYNNVLTQLHHITEQLHAFWDQQFNLHHVPLMAKLSDIFDAIGNMDLEVEVNLNSLKTSIDSMSQNVQNKLQSVQEGVNNKIQESTEKVEEAVEKHGNFIIDGLKDLFIPSDDYFKSYFDDLFDYFSERFGFLSFPFDLLSRFVDLIVGTSDKDCVLTLPSFEIMGEQLLYEQSFNLTQFLEENFGFLLVAIRWGINLILLMRFVDLCGDKWNEVMIR